MIKAAKWAVNAVLGNAEVTEEELVTAFTGAEVLLKRRLTYQLANPKDDVLTIDTKSLSDWANWRLICPSVGGYYKLYSKEEMENS